MKRVLTVPITIEKMGEMGISEESDGSNRMDHIGKAIRREGLFFRIYRGASRTDVIATRQACSDASKERDCDDEYQADDNPCYAAVDSLNHTCDAQVMDWHYLRA